MRTAYGAIFVGCAVVGFASVFNSQTPAPAGPLTTNLSAPRQVSPPEPLHSTITVQTELIEPSIVRTDIAPAVTPAARPAAQRSRVRPRPPRSLFAKLVFGDGQARPQPFPSVRQ